jgi:hypothetical protein
VHNPRQGRAPFVIRRWPQVQWQKNIATEVGVEFELIVATQCAPSTAKFPQALENDVSVAQIAKRSGHNRHSMVGIAFRICALFPLRPRARNCRPHESKRAPRKD